MNIEIEYQSLTVGVSQLKRQLLADKSEKHWTDLK